MNKGLTFGNDKVSYPSRLELRNSEEVLRQSPGSHIERNKLVVNNFSSGSSLNLLNFILESDDNESIFPLGRELDSYSVSVAINESSRDLVKLNLRGDATV